MRLWSFHKLTIYFLYRTYYNVSSMCSKLQMKERLVRVVSALNLISKDRYSRRAFEPRQWPYVNCLRFNVTSFLFRKNYFDNNISIWIMCLDLKPYFGFDCTDIFPLLHNGLYYVDINMKTNLCILWLFW